MALSNAFRDLREMTAYLEKRGLLRRVRLAVSPNYELAEVAERTSRLENGGPVLLFEELGGRWPLLTNLLSNPARLAWSLGLNNLGELDQQLVSLLNPAGSLDLGEWLSRLGETAYASRYSPKTVKYGPCQEVVLDDPTAWRKLPLLRSREAAEPGLAGVLFSRADSQPNTQAGAARLLAVGDELFLDGLTLAAGEKRAVAVAFGGDPALLFAAHAPFLPSTDPLWLAGALCKRRIEVVRAKTSPVEVPALAEVVLEGVAEPTGQPGRASFRPLSLTHRKDPLLVTLLPNTGEMDNLVQGAERLLLPLLRRSLPEISGLSFVAPQGRPDLALVAIAKSYPGQAQKVMYALWGLTELRFLRHIVVVDNDCPLDRPAALLNHLLNQIDPARDLLVVKGPLAGPSGFGTKVGLDATRKLPGEADTSATTTPAVTTDLTVVAQKVAQRWLEYGIE